MALRKLNLQRLGLGKSGDSDKKSNNEMSSGLLGMNPSFEPGGSGSVSPALRQWYKLVTAISTGPVSINYSREDEERQGDDFLKKFSTRTVNFVQNGNVESVPRRWTNVQRKNSLFRSSTRNSARKKVIRRLRKYVLAPDGSFVFYWLALISVVVFYNWWTIILREAFTTSERNFHAMWIQLDLLADFIYFLDIVREIRTGYLEEGLVVVDAIKLCKRYVLSLGFLLDVFCLLPTKLVSVWAGLDDHALIRSVRLIKTHKVMLFVAMIETRTVYPNLFRCANLTHILLLTCHWFACFHFMIAKATGFQTAWSQDWTSESLPNMTTHRKYLLSVYWATLTLTTVGNNAVPTTNWEYLFSIISYLFGIFTFATIVGQVGNVIANRNTSRLEFERLLDGAKQYMRHHRVPKSMQKRVQQWYDYSFSRGRMTDGSDIESLSVLPDKLKTELSLHVNLDTLKKVSIFQECQPEFLHDLVLKMRAIIFTPGDIVCRKGEIAREMYIIADGVLEVIDEDGQVIHEMRSGDFFGEIGILNLDGGITNFRRTADVRSVGYSELFSLAKEDVLTATKDFPEAEDLLRKHGCDRLAREKSKTNLKKRSTLLNGGLSPLVEPAQSPDLVSAPVIAQELGKDETASREDSRSQISDRKKILSPVPTQVHTAGSLKGKGKAKKKAQSGFKERRRSSAVPSLVTNLLGCRVRDSPLHSRAISVRVPGKSATVWKARSLDNSPSSQKNMELRLKVWESDMAKLGDRLLLLVPPRLREDLKTEINVMNEIFHQLKGQIHYHEDIILHIRRENSRLKELLNRSTDIPQSSVSAVSLISDEHQSSDRRLSNDEMIV